MHPANTVGCAVRTMVHGMHPTFAELHQPDNYADSW